MPCGKIQIFFGKCLPCVGYAFRLSRRNKRHLHHSLIFLKGADILRRILCCRCLPGNQLLKLRLVSENCLNSILNQIQTLAQILDRRLGHLSGRFLRHRIYSRPQNNKNQYNGDEQGDPSMLFPFDWFLFHTTYLHLTARSDFN